MNLASQSNVRHLSIVHCDHTSCGIIPIDKFIGSAEPINLSVGIMPQDATAQYHEWY